MNEDIPSVFTPGYIHHRKTSCPSCLGGGFFNGGETVCGVCWGNGTTEKGCIGIAEVDLNHPQLGAYCRTEAMFVPLNEVTKL